MIITENIKLEKVGGSNTFCKLLIKTVITNPDTKEKRFEWKGAMEYGNVYKALQHLVQSDYSLEIDEDMLTRLKEIVGAIKEASEAIKKEFRTEVLVEKV